MEASAQRPVPRRAVSTLLLPPSLRQKLINAGFQTTGDLDGISAENLAKGASLTADEAQEVMNALVTWAAPTASATGGVSAQEIFEHESRRRKIVTFCQELDSALGGGVATGQVTEFCGVPAVGKTQLGIQLAIDVQLPRCFGGLGAKAIYVDTEGSFMAERAADIADAFVEHLRKIAKHSSSTEKHAAVEELSRDSLLDGILYLRIKDHVEQAAAVHMLPQLLDAHPEVKLVVVDSMAFHFRQILFDMMQRTRVLTDMGQRLMQLAAVRDIAVVLTNQITTRQTDDGVSKLIPCLGDSWAHQATTRVILYWEGIQRRAHIYKSPSLPAATADYFITEAGFRGRKPQKRARE